MRIAARWGALVALYVVGQALGGVLMPVELSGGADARAPQPWQLPVYLAVTLPMLAYLVHRPRVRGWAQLGLVALLVWGVQTFMTQLETAYFWSAFPGVSGRQMLYLFLRNAVTLALFLPAALWLTGRLRPGPAPHMDVRAALGPDARLAWKLPALGAAYVVLYFVFGYFVAWQFEAIRVFYTGSPLLEGFGAQLRATVAERPSIVAFQFLRGMLWVGFAWPMLASLGRSRWEQTLAGAVLLGLLPTTQLVFDNPLMPAEVRLGHFLEVTASMALFGALVARVMGPRAGGRMAQEPAAMSSPSAGAR